MGSSSHKTLTKSLLLKGFADAKVVVFETLPGGRNSRHCLVETIQDTAQCADSEVRNAIERTPYIVVLKFHVFILISKSFNFRSPLDRILRYLTKTWFYTLNFKKNSCWWLSIAYWVIENDSVSDTKEHIFVGPLELKILSSLKQMTLTKYNWMPLLFGTH